MQCSIIIFQYYFLDAGLVFIRQMTFIIYFQRNFYLRLIFCLYNDAILHFNCMDRSFKQWFHLCKNSLIYNEQNKEGKFVTLMSLRFYFHGCKHICQMICQIIVTSVGTLEFNLLMRCSFLTNHCH